MDRKPFKTPDLHAPRKREKAINFLAYPKKDPYGFFAKMKEQYPDLRQYSNNEIANWIKQYLQELANEVLNNRRGVELPGNLGAIMVGLIKPTRPTMAYNIDFNASRNLGVQVHHSNLHADGFLAKIYYYNNIPRRRLKIHNLISFKPCRKLSRAVSAIMRTEGEYKRYYYFTNHFKIIDLYRRRKSPKQVNNTILLEGYDPFAFD